MIRGRPIRFLASIVGGWTAMRIAMMLPLPINILAPPPQLAQWKPGGDPMAAAVGRQLSEDEMAIVRVFPVSPGVPSGEGFGTAQSARMSRSHVAIKASFVAPPTKQAGWSSAVADSLLAAQLAYSRAPRPPVVLASFAPGMGLSPGEGGAPGHSAFSGEGRWSGGAWALWRRDGDQGQARLGGAQAGVRVDYLLARSSPLHPTLYGRVSTALQGAAAAEVATGIAIRPPLPFPVTVAVERREPVSAGGRSDFAILAAGGVNPVDVGHGFRLDGYGQAGVVGLERRDAFVDGRVTVERPLVGSLAIGAAVWGGAQPGVARLDIGPQASVRLRLGGANMRLGAEWRAQVAGNAAPSSGPALSFGTDF